MAVWSHAEQADVEDGVVQLSRVRLRGLIKIEIAVTCRHLMDPVLVKRQRRKLIEGLLGVAVSIISWHKTFVAPPQLDSRPVDGGIRAFAPESLVGPGGDPPTGERELGNRKSR